MEIKSIWKRPVQLTKSKLDSAIFDINFSKIPQEPGCYVFIKKYSDKITPLYIGQASNLRSRIKGQLDNVKISKRIENSGKGIKLVLFCTIELKKGQQLKKVLNILEKNLIRTAIDNGFELFNKQLTIIKHDELEFKQNNYSSKLFPKRMASIHTKNI